MKNPPKMTRFCFKCGKVEPFYVTKPKTEQMKLSHQTVNVKQVRAICMGCLQETFPATVIDWNVLSVHKAYRRSLLRHLRIREWLIVVLRDIRMDFRRARRGELFIVHKTNKALRYLYKHSR